METVDQLQPLLFLLRDEDDDISQTSENTIFVRFYFTLYYLMLTETFATLEALFIYKFYKN